MTAELYWSEAALAQLAAIAEHIGATSPVYAERVVDRLTLRCEQAQRLPLSGRSVPEYDRQEVRELIEPANRNGPALGKLSSGGDEFASSSHHLIRP